MGKGAGFRARIWGRVVGALYVKHYPKRTLKVGDLVMVVEDGLPRDQWSTAIIEETTTRDDELPRKAKLRLANRYLDRNGVRMEKATIVQRPIQKLIKLLPVEIQ